MLSRLSSPFLRGRYGSLYPDEPARHASDGRFPLLLPKSRRNGQKSFKNHFRRTS
jgi:hypothetical protein